MSTHHDLDTIREKLLEHHGDVPGPPTDDPFELVLWEQVAYLAPDEKRAETFGMLASRVGLSPADLLKADRDDLVEIAGAGGAIAREKRASRMRESAEIVAAEWDGDLRGGLGLPFAKARSALTKFPSIGKPGAEKILLLTRSHPVLALDSNGLRVLLRVGYGEESERYDKSYASVREATGPEVRDDYDWLIPLHHLLRRHGREVCRNTRPQCSDCPLAGGCAYHRSATAKKRREDGR